MSRSLDNHTLRSALLQRGFRDITSENRSTKSWRLQHPQMRHWVSIKLAKDVNQPMATSPLVVHPDDASQIRLALRPDAGVTVEPTPFKGGSTKYDGLPGYALALADMTAVDAFVAVATGTAAALASTAPPQPAPQLQADPHRQLAALSAADYAQALVATADRITAAQRAMLLAHGQAPGHRLSMEAIAMHGGYDSHTAANSQYGRLGRLLAKHFGIDGLDNQTQALAIGADDPDARGHFVWEMRPSLVAALRNLGWLTVAEDRAVTPVSAAIELDAEGVERPPTTRQALINARVGQGLYREQVLDLWDQRCAVTGCTVRSALIASHARAWKDSSDAQRLDPYNGLPLTASIDRLFDQGLIGFADDGGLLRKPGVTDVDLGHLGLRPDARLRAEGLNSRHFPYLAAHRACHGF